ncbi:phosphatase PAP2 family protein [bacterium]|nr:phosphatase PAP2 family protein [bacterium]
MKSFPPVLAFLAAAAGLFLLALALDPWAWTSLTDPGAKSEEWNVFLRVLGELPIWLVLALAWRLMDRGAARHTAKVPGGGLLAVSRAAFLFVATLLAGAASEGLKLLLRRERPGLHDGAHVFRSFADNLWSTSGLGLPSGHTTLAFAAAFTLAALWPRAGPLFILLAAGTGLTRLLAGSHFLSDVALAATVGYGASWLARLWLGRSSPRA